MALRIRLALPQMYFACIVFSKWARWFSGKFGALRLEGRRIESHSSRHIETLGMVKSFTCSCL